jgi:hypothetical protein
MANIIAGIVETEEAANRAVAALEAQGFGRDDVTTFYLNPPGQHATYPIGGDTHHDAGTKDAGKTAAAGAAVGGITGLALGTAVAAATDSGLGAVAAIAGAGVGAYVGSLAGGLSGTEQGKSHEATTEEPVERNAGYMIAVRADDDGAERKAIDILRAQGAHDMGRASGAWLPGAQPAWTDFDPRKPIQRV